MNRETFIRRLKSSLNYLWVISIEHWIRPSVLAIELTNRCNADCIMCGRELNPRERTDMDFSLFKKIVFDAKENGINVIQLSFYGEPLLYPKLLEAIQFIKEHINNSVVVIDTNATLLDKKKAKELLDAGLAHIFISIDGNNKTDFEQIRLGLKWEEVRQNVKDLHELISKFNYPTSVSIRGLDLKDFPLDKNQYSDLWEPYADELITRKEHNLRKFEKEKISHQLLPCKNIFTQLIMLVNGDVTICAYDWEGSMVYGKFPDKNIKQLWRTPSLIIKRLLHFFLLKKSITYCRKCTFRFY